MGVGRRLMRKKSDEAERQGKREAECSCFRNSNIKVVIRKIEVLWACLAS